MIIGIDLGTTNSLVSVWKDDRILLIPNKFGSLLTPSVVSFEDDIVYIGEVAKERLISMPQNTISSFKRSMGNSQTFFLDNKFFTPQELSAFIIRQLKEDAENYLGETVTEAIISVPAYFNDDQRQATKEAGILAGIKVDRVINEPSAAALASRTLHNKNNSIMLVIDLGGGTFDVSVVECFENVVSVLAVSGNNYLGGDDFDLAIGKHFCKKNNIDFDLLDLETKNIILKNSEICKRELSLEDITIININTQKINAKLTITRAELVNICNDLFLKIQMPIKDALLEAGIAIKEIEEIILVGGGCKIKIVSQFIEYILKKKPLYLGSPDETVAKGLGIYSGIKARSNSIKDVFLTDISPFSIGIATINQKDKQNPYFSTIIKKNTVLPVSKIETYSPVEKNQKQLLISVYQGNNFYVKENLFLGELVINLPTGDYLEPANNTIDVKFTYDLNGILDIEVVVNSTGEKVNKVLLSKSSKMQYIKNTGIVDNIDKLDSLENINDISDLDIKNKIQNIQNFKNNLKIDEELQLLIDTSKSMYTQTTGNIQNEILTEFKLFMININSTQSRNKKSKLMEQFYIKIEKFKEDYFKNYRLFEGIDENNNWSWHDDIDDIDDID